MPYKNTFIFPLKNSIFKKAQSIHHIKMGFYQSQSQASKWNTTFRCSETFHLQISIICGEKLSNSIVPEHVYLLKLWNSLSVLSWIGGTNSGTTWLKNLHSSAILFIPVNPGIPTVRFKYFHSGSLYSGHVAHELDGFGEPFLAKLVQ